MTEPEEFEPRGKELRLKIDRKVRALIKGKKWCPNCWLWLPPERFGPSASYCHDCESLRARFAYRRRKVLPAMSGDKPSR